MNKVIGQKKYFYEEIDSTNEEAKRLAGKEVPEGTLVLANSQTQGKGKFGRNWFSPTNSGLYFSIILYQEHKELIPLEISLLAAVACAQAIPNARVKWPNDVVVLGKKVGGILIETISAPRKRRAIIVGIGLNMNIKNFPKELKETAASISLALGIENDKDKLLGLILREFEKLYAGLKKGHTKEILEEWKQWSDTLGSRVKIVTVKGEFFGEAVGLGERGELILKTLDGKIMQFNTGDVF